MKYRIVKSKDLKSNNWAGGTTTQLYIFPETADYQKRNFGFRISTATVELEKSDFTPLPEVSRKLMILEGEIEIKHENHYAKQLKKFDLDTFEGNWKTSSLGRCTDFNLMCMGQAKGEISAHELDKNELLDYKTELDLSHLLLYNYSGKISIKLDNKDLILDKGDVLLIESMPISQLEITSFNNSELILAEIIA